MRGGLLSIGNIEIEFFLCVKNFYELATNYTVIQKFYVKSKPQNFSLHYKELNIKYFHSWQN